MWNTIRVTWLAEITPPTPLEPPPFELAEAKTKKDDNAFWPETVGLAFFEPLGGIFVRWIVRL